MTASTNFLYLYEKNHVEKPFLKQLETMLGIHWDI